MTGHRGVRAVTEVHLPRPADRCNVAADLGVPVGTVKSRVRGAPVRPPDGLRLIPLALPAARSRSERVAVHVRGPPVKAARTAGRGGWRLLELGRLVRSTVTQLQSAGPVAGGPPVKGLADATGRGRPRRLMTSSIQRPKAGGDPEHRQRGGCRPRLHRAHATNNVVTSNSTISASSAAPNAEPRDDSCGNSTHRVHQGKRRRRGNLHRIYHRHKLVPHGDNFLRCPPGPGQSLMVKGTRARRNSARLHPQPAHRRASCPGHLVGPWAGSLAGRRGVVASIPARLGVRAVLGMRRWASRPPRHGGVGPDGAARGVRPQSSKWAAASACSRGPAREWATTSSSIEHVGALGTPASPVTDGGEVGVGVVGRLLSPAAISTPCTGRQTLGISASSNGLRRIDACSAGRTIVPDFIDPHGHGRRSRSRNSWSVTWLVLDQAGCVGEAASIQGQGLIGVDVEGGR